jgi:hypothetical protein
MKTQCLFYVQGTTATPIAGDSGNRDLDSLLRDGWGIVSVTPGGVPQGTRDDSAYAPVLQVAGVYVVLEWDPAEHASYPGPYAAK